MKTTKHGIGGLVFAVTLLVASAAVVMAEQDLPCRPNLVPCNYAEHFSGTIHWRSVLKVSADASSGRTASDSVNELTVTVVAGKATCAGTIDGKAVRGAGAVAVERGSSMEDDPGQPWYELTVACPGPDGVIPSIDNAQIKTYKQKDATGLKKLAGKTEEENPDADPGNGVTGTLLLEWSLSRSGGSRP